MADQILPKGIRMFNKHSNAPDFVVGTLVITPNELVTWLKEQPELLSDYNGAKQIRLQVKKSKDGNLYCDVDTYKKDTAPAVANNLANAPVTELPDTQDLPF
jgi:hypothetical protein